MVVVFLFTRPLISFLSRYCWFSRSRPTGFHGPDGGEPVTTTAVSAARRRQAAGAPAPGAPAPAGVSMRKA